MSGREFLFSGKGSVYSYTTIFDRQYAPSGFEYRTPYTEVLVELDEGTRVTAMLVDLDTSRPRTTERPEDQRVYIGQPVEMVTRRLFEDEGDRGDRGKGMIVYGFVFRPELQPAPPEFSLEKLLELAMRSAADPEDETLNAAYEAMFGTVSRR